MNNSKRIQYSALLALAVIAFGLAGLALTSSRGAGDVGRTVTAIPPAATETSTAAAATTPTPTVLAQRLKIQLPAEPVLLILGDSYTAGVGANRPDRGWAYRVAETLGYPTNIDGMAGTGFASGGDVRDGLALRFSDRMQKIADNPNFVPNVLILQGGNNESLISSPDEIESATALTIESTRKLWPGVQVVVFGPSAPQPLSKELRAANSAVRAGAAAAVAPFIDADEAGWFTSVNSPGLSFDGSDVNTAGHQYISEKFLESWASLVQ